jgi:ubiquinone/menaquinone biosynthesis C-methylase UbiE
MAYCFDTVAPIYDLVMPRKRPEEFLGFLDARSDDNILEVGAGTGRIAKHYAPRAGSAVLLEPSHRMLKRAQRIVPDAVHVQGTAEAMHFGDGSFCKVICFDSIHHWQDQPRGLEEVHRVLGDGGLLAVVEVDPSTFWGHKVAWMERCLGMRSRFHAPEPLMRMMESAGFRDVEWKDVGSNMTYGVVARR